MTIPVMKNIGEEDVFCFVTVAAALTVICSPAFGETECEPVFYLRQRGDVFRDPIVGDDKTAAVFFQIVKCAEIDLVVVIFDVVPLVVFQSEAIVRVSFPCVHHGWRFFRG